MSWASRFFNYWLNKATIAFTPPVQNRDWDPSDWDNDDWA